MSNETSETKATYDYKKLEVELGNAAADATEAQELHAHCRRKADNMRRLQYPAKQIAYWQEAADTHAVRYVRLVKKVTELKILRRLLKKAEKEGKVEIVGELS